MNRTALIAFPITLFLAWWMYVITRAGNCPGLQWNRVSDNARWSATMVGVAYVVFVLIALIVLYFTRLRGTSVSASTVVVPALMKLAAVHVAAIVLSIPLAEWYCVLDERAFRQA